MNLEESVEWRRGGNSSHSGYSAGSTSSAGHHLNQDTTDNNYNNDNPHHHNILDDYDLGQCIGRGGFATVYKATRRRFSPAACLPRTHAIKIIHKQDLIQQKKLSLSRIHNEIAIHRQLQHPNIVQFLDR